MENYRLKIKVGEHEFEAEGPTDVVQSQFDAFKDLIAGIPSTGTAKKSVESTQSPVDNGSSAGATDLALDRITRVDGRYISLTVRPETVEDALMIILFGQRKFRGNDSVTGSELLDGLRQSGIAVTRVDWRLEKLAGEGLVIKIGAGRASRYRLTNQGVNRAQDLARNLIALVP